MAKDNRSKTIFNRMQNYFGIGISLSKDIKNPSDALTGVVKPSNRGYDNKIVKSPFSNETQALLDYYVNTCHDNVESWQNRSDLNEDMDMLYYNSPIMAKAMELTADEVEQADSNQQPLFIEAKAKVKKEFMAFADKTNLFSQIRPTAMDIIQYGNAVWGLSLGEDGVDEIIPKNVNSLRDRIEFNPSEIREQMSKKGSLAYKLSGIAKIKSLMNTVKEKVNNEKKYLFAFQIDDKVLPPWQVLHFRNLTNKSPFAPFGIPLFIHSLATYRQFDSSMTFQAVARGMMFPKDKYSVDIPNVVDPTDKLNRVVEVMNELTNSGINSTNSNSQKMNDVIVTIQGLFDYEQITPDMDLGKIGDIELLHDNLINGTFLPRYLLDPNDGGFGDSGTGAIQKWKPFARLVYRIQNILLQNITQAFKIHLLHRQDFSQEDLDFVLSMPFPESQVDDDMISNQGDLLSLAGDIIDDLSDRLLDGDPLPPELIKTIYNKFLPYDDNIIDGWVKDTLKAKPSEEVEESTKQNKRVELYNKKILNEITKKTSKNKLEESINKWQKLEEKVGKRNLKEQVDNIVLEKRQETLREGKLRGRHYYSSRNNYSDFQAESFVTIKKDLLQEDAQTSTNIETLSIPKKKIVESAYRHGRIKK